MGEVVFFHLSWREREGPAPQAWEGEGLRGPQ
jgi:hypothetical protein